MLFSALLGNPVDHSVSSDLYSEYARIANLEYAHLKLQVPTVRELPIYLNSLATLQCVGVNITIPYKLAVRADLDEEDDRARAIGAVNTIVMRDGRKIGYNTDGVGAYRAIETWLRPVSGTDRIVMLGAGGAARAILYELYQRTEQITVLGVVPAELQQLQADFSALGQRPLTIQPLTETTLLQTLTSADFLINATPVGMYPDHHQSLISEQLARQLEHQRDCRTLYAFDAIFNPHTTLMLQRLAAYGAPICSGIWMMIYQAVEAFRLWTGHDVSQAPFTQIEAKLRQSLAQHYPYE